MRMKWFNTLVLLALVLGTLPFAAPSSALATAPVDDVRDNETAGIVHGEVEGATEPTLYIVQLHAPALASYSGTIPSLAATTPSVTGAERLDPQAPASIAYLNYLQAEQRDALAAVEATLNRSVEMAYQYLAALNGFAVRLSPQEAARVAGLPQVRAVYRDVERELDTDVGPLLIGAPAIWNGDTGLGVATRGEGIVIGVLDTGINPQHPSFAATDGDGYAHTNPYGAGIYRGWCASNPGFCNEKLIAAYTFHPNGGSPVDTNGHGSHTAGTAGGNAHTATFDVGNDTYNIPIQGVAPRANIVAYKVCDPSCPSTASVAAVNSAILNDDVDVLNYSISGGDSPWTDAVDLAFLDAHNAGIFVSASAGNSGSGPNTVAKTGPWNASVAAGTHNRAIVQTLDVTGPTAPAGLQGLAAVPGENTAILVNITGELRYDPGNNLGCTPFAAGTFTGSLALIQRGGCTFNEKVNHAVAAGATHVVIFNSVGGPPISMGGLTGTPPAVMLDLAGGAALRDYVVANAGTTVRINAATSLVYEDDWTDIVAGFSSRGPSQFELLKPDYIAPGVNILAAVESQGGDPVQYGFQQGTSMSSPHAAGAAALMMALHPTWSPSEIKSALASTAVGGLTKEDGLTPADPFDVGSGRLDLSLASRTGLVFSETGANYLAANPATGGDPKTLNQPSLVSYNCVGTCTWTRTVKSVLSAPATYTAVATAPVGMVVTVTPSTFTIAPGATQELEITVAVTGMTPGSYAFASIALETAALQNGMAVADTYVPIVVIPVADAPLLTLDPAEVTSNQGTNMTVDKILTIGNEGGVDLEWEVTENLLLCDAPGAVDWVDVAPVLGTVAPSGTQDVTVTFDSTGLGVGEYNANLCIASNDPARPLALVPLTLEVAAEPQVDVDPDSLVSMQGVDTQSNLTLDITNTGLADLEWFVGEAALLAGVSPAGPIPSAMPNLPVGGDRAAPTLAGVSAPSSIMPTGSPAHLYGWSEGFDDITLLPGQGWALINNSVPLGSTGWFQGNSGVFGSHSGAANSYIGANFNNVAGANTISNWLLTPETVFNNGDTFSFWTRRSGSQWQDRLQVRLSTAGAGTNVGTSATSVGDFTELLLDINPTYGTDYPAVWTEFVITISGLSAPTNGRLAFRYFVENGGPSGARSDYIGIDTVVYTPALPKMLYDNGPFVTSYGDGPGGSDVSLLQNISLGMTTLGSAVNPSTGDHFRIADAFTVSTPGGWSIDNVSFYAYQTGSPITSTFTSVNYRIWDGSPNDPASTVVFGDVTTNRIVDTSWTGAYRYTENTVGTARPIMSVIGEAGLHLEPGTYWLDWQLDGSVASGPWQPPITRLGETTTGNALQLVASGWQPSVDTGLGTPQGAPFKLWGTTVCDVPSDVSWLSVSPASGTTLPGETDQVIVTLDSTGLAVGDYTAYLCVNSNDPQNPVVVVPVTLDVVEVYTLDVTVDPAEGGTVEIDPDQDTYVYGDEVTLTATAASGWVFSGWSGDASGTNSVTTVTIEGDTAVTATFEQEAYTLDVFVTPSGAGTVAIAPDQDTYVYGDEVTLTANAAPGWVFSG